MIDWLLNSDPAIRWQAIRDLTAASAEEVTNERARVVGEGWGAALLARQGSDGAWGGQPDSTGWDSTNREWNSLLSLLWLRDFGADPQRSPVAEATKRTAQNVTWKWWDNRPFFQGEVEPCINGRVLALAAYFGHDSGDLVERLLSEQMADGGWNCEQENGSVRGSFHSTINVLEGLRGHQQRSESTAYELAAALDRGEEYLLSRRLMFRRTTGDLVDPAFTELCFPTGYHYDVLRALDYFRVANRPDERLDEALALIEGKRRPDGRWHADAARPDQLDIGAADVPGQPGRWTTLRALRVLRWAGRAAS